VRDDRKGGRKRERVLRNKREREREFRETKERERERE
jgi:hypothetical protein